MWALDAAIEGCLEAGEAAEAAEADRYVADISVPEALLSSAIAW